MSFNRPKRQQALGNLWSLKWLCLPETKSFCNGIEYENEARLCFSFELEWHIICSYHLLKKHQELSRWDDPTRLFKYSRIGVFALVEGDGSVTLDDQYSKACSHSLISVNRP